MKNKTINKMIPKAIEAINENKNFKDGIPSEFNGYMSSFGASVVLNGLVPTILFFTNESAKSNEDRSIVVKLIETIIKKMNGEYKINNSLLETAIKEDNRYFIDYVKSASVALKMSVRTFEFKKGE